MIGDPANAENGDELTIDDFSDSMVIQMPTFKEKFF